MANEFFGKFAEQLDSGEGEAATDAADAAAPAEPAAAEATPASEAAPAPSGGISPVIWIGGLIAVVVIGLIIFS